MVLIDMEMPKRCGECFNCDRNFNDGEKTIENWMCLCGCALLVIMKTVVGHNGVRSNRLPPPPMWCR